MLMLNRTATDTHQSTLLVSNAHILIATDNSDTNKKIGYNKMTMTYTPSWEKKNNKWDTEPDYWELLENEKINLFSN